MTADAVREAHDRIRSLIHRTPVMTSATLDRESGNRVFLKCENLQRAGAVTFRGACNAVCTERTVAAGNLLECGGPPPHSKGSLN
jgi:threonine dehydratase